MTGDAEIRSEGDLASLPEGSIVIDASGDVMFKVWGKPSGRDDFWSFLGNEHEAPVHLPVMLIWSTPRTYRNALVALDESRRLVAKRTAEVRVLEAKVAAALAYADDLDESARDFRDAYGLESRAQEHEAMARTLRKDIEEAAPE